MNVQCYIMSYKTKYQKSPPILNVMFKSVSYWKLFVEKAAKSASIKYAMVTHQFKTREKIFNFLIDKTTKLELILSSFLDFLFFCFCTFHASQNIKDQKWKVLHYY